MSKIMDRCTDPSIKTFSDPVLVGERPLLLVMDLSYHKRLKRMSVIPTKVAYSLLCLPSTALYGPPSIHRFIESSAAS